MSPGAYAFVFDMSRATLKAAPVRERFELLHNGAFVAEHARREDAEGAAEQLAKTCGIDRACFSVREVRL